MYKKLYLLLFVYLIFCVTQINAQENCEFKKPLKVTELRGQLLFKHQLSLYSIRMASVSITRSKNSESILEIQPDNNGRFEFTELKQGKYYLSVDSLVGIIDNLEFEIIPKSNQNVSDNQIELILREEKSPCEINTVKNFTNNKLAGSAAIPLWDDITEITLERMGCYGRCPREKTTLQKDGTAIYIGHKFVSKIGMFKGKFEYDFERLAELFYRQGFFNLKDRYEVPITDLATIKITAVRNDKSKTVEIYGGICPVELWGMEIAFDSIANKIEWTPYLPKSELKNVDLSRIAYIAPKGRVQDKEYNQIRTIEKLIAVGKDSIPFLIDKLDDETKIKHHVKNYWSEVSVGDLALIVLTNFFLDSSWQKSTIPNVGWDEFLERGEDKNSTGEDILRNYIEKHGRKKIKDRWQKIWEENKENIYWDKDDQCFKIKNTLVTEQN